MIAATVSDTAWDTLELTGDDFEYLGRAIQDIVVDVEMRSAPATFEFRVCVQRRFRNGDWTPGLGSLTSSEVLIGPQTGEGYYVSSAFSDRARFGYRTRLILQYHARSTGGGVVGNSAQMSISAAVRFFAT